MSTTLTQATDATYNVLSMPTLILIRGGEPVTTVVGARPRAAILAEIKAHSTRP